MLGPIAACAGKTDKAADAVGQETAGARPPMTAGAATPTAAAVPAPPPPDTGAASADSELPPPSYASVPGWLVMGGRGFPRHIGDSTDSDRRAYTGIDIDSGIIIFPADARWARVGTGTALTLLQPVGSVTLYPGGAAEHEQYSPATLLRARALPAVELRKLSIGWMLPASSSAAMTALVVRDSVAPDSSAMTWTADSVRFVLRLTGKRSAELSASRLGRNPVHIFGMAVDSAADEDMGVDSDSLLTLDNWRMPSVVAAFRLGDPWPVVAVIYFSGYECSNHSVVVFTASSIRSIDDPHYYECQH